MLAIIFGDDTPVCYLRGGKKKTIVNAKDLVQKLNKKNYDNLPNSFVLRVQDYSQFSFHVLKSLEEFK